MTIVEIVSVLATTSLIALQLGPAPAVLEILRTRSTGVTPFVPLVTLGVNGWSWAMYGFLGGNIFPVAISNFTGAVLSVVYTFIYYRFTQEQAYAHKVLAFFSLLVAILTLFAITGVQGYTGQTREQVQNVIGFAGIATVLIFFVSPFENIALVFRHRNAVFIPIVLVTAGAVNSVLWVLYCLLVSDCKVSSESQRIECSTKEQEKPSQESRTGLIRIVEELAAIPTEPRVERNAYGAINA